VGRFPSRFTRGVVLSGSGAGSATGSDKKNIGGVRRFVLPVGIGNAGVVEDVKPAELETAVRYMLEQAKQ